MRVSVVCLLDAGAELRASPAGQLPETTHNSRRQVYAGQLAAGARHGAKRGYEDV